MKEQLIEYAKTLQAHYSFKVLDQKNGAIGFTRCVPCGASGVRTIGIGYSIDPAYDFATNCKSIEDRIIQDLFRFDDQFYIDRGNGVPLVTDAVLDHYNHETGQWETRRLDSIDWLTVH